MYSWPSELRASIFQGAVLEAILFSRNTVVFHFNIDLSLTLYHGGILCTKSVVEDIIVPPTETCLPSLIGDSVVNGVIEDDGVSLRLIFGAGMELTVIGRDAHYECYLINFGGKEYVI